MKPKAVQKPRNPDYTRRAVLGLSLLLIFCLGAGKAQSQMLTPAPLLRKVINQIESRQLDWIAFKADLELHFLTADTDKASCHGDLLYHRLDEKILLKCTNDSGKLLFVFKTEDRDFELYLPQQKTVFYGDIFDLSFSPNVESHIRPLDFYRALKPMAIPLRETELEEMKNGMNYLRIHRVKDMDFYLFRDLVSLSDGSVPLETYYSDEGSPTLVIRRSDFRQVLLEDKRKINFPYRIEMDATQKNEETFMLFQKIDFPEVLDDSAWNVPLPEDQTLDKVHLSE